MKFTVKGAGFLALWRVLYAKGFNLAVRFPHIDPLAEPELSKIVYS
jgi:hypothetical protein